jgi:hypothetical protein
VPVLAYTCCNDVRRTAWCCCLNVGFLVDSVDWWMVSEHAPRWSRDRDTTKIPELSKGTSAGHCFLNIAKDRHLQFDIDG